MENPHVPGLTRRPEEWVTNNFKSLLPSSNSLLLLTGSGTCGCQQPS
jgi:hypothetical protein